MNYALCIMNQLLNLLRLPLPGGVVGSAGGLVRKSYLMDSLGFNAGAKDVFKTLSSTLKLRKFDTP